MRRSVSLLVAALVVAAAGAPFFVAPEVAQARKEFNTKSAPIAKYTENSDDVGGDPDEFCNNDPENVVRGSAELKPKEGKTKPDTVDGTVTLRNAIIDPGPPTVFANKREYEIYVLAADDKDGNGCTAIYAGKNFFTNKHGHSADAKNIDDSKLDDADEPKEIKFKGVDIDGFVAFGIGLLDISDDCFDFGECAHFRTPNGRFQDFSGILSFVNPLVGVDPRDVGEDPILD